MFEDPDGPGPLPEAQVGGALTGTTYSHNLAGQLLYKRVNASYRLRACDANGCGAFTAALTPDVTKAIGYFKASNNTSPGDFGSAVALSTDGKTLAVGAPSERSKSTGINGDEADAGAQDAGAVYVFTRQSTAAAWSQQAYVKASNTQVFARPITPVGPRFGASLALSADGSTLAVGAPDERSNARGVNGDQTNTDTPGAGAAYVFTRAGNTWSQQAYVKASNTLPKGAFGTDIISANNVLRRHHFGASVALSADGSLLAVGSPGEDSNATGVNGNQDDHSRWKAGAVYTYVRSGSTWAHQAYLKAHAGDEVHFGNSVSLSGDGATLAVGAPYDYGNPGSGQRSDGAAYVFTHSGNDWSQQAYLKISDAGVGGKFGDSVAVSADGNTLAARGEVGFVVLFTRTGAAWNEQARVTGKSSSMALSGDGSTLIVGWTDDASSATGINGSENNSTAVQAGGVRLYQRSGAAWSQRTYLKASNAEADDRFGSSVALSGDGTTLAAGATSERSKATGVQGDQTDNSGPAPYPHIPGYFFPRVSNYGAVYLY